MFFRTVIAACVVPTTLAIRVQPKPKPPANFQPFGGWDHKKQIPNCWDLKKIVQKEHDKKLYQQQQQKRQQARQQQQKQKR